MPAVADITRSRRQRAGSRRNKRLRNVGSFNSDFRRTIDLQPMYARASTIVVPPVQPINPDHQDHLHVRFLEGLSGIRVRRTKAQRSAAIETRVPRGN